MTLRLGRAVLALAIVVCALVTPGAEGEARAQSLPPPQRDAAWETVSTVSMALGMTTQVLMPRIYLSDSEVTVGWKARFHGSVLASTMSLVGLALLNEYAIRPGIGSYRPGCGPSNIGVAGCTTYGMPSSHAFVAFSALGHGTAVFLVDSWKWSDSHYHPGAIAGDVGVPLVAAALTFAGRVAGAPSQEHLDQVVVGAAFGLGFGLIAGGLYSYFQRAECGYGAGVICW
jgi:hypothetical protein